MSLTPAPQLGVFKALSQLYSLLRGLPPGLIGEIVMLVRDALRGQEDTAMRRAKAIASKTAAEATIREFLKRKKGL